MKVKQIIQFTIFFVASFSLNFLSEAQTVFRNSDLVVFDQEGHELKTPFAGGLNAPQFSNVDFNQDGLDDIFVFDRSGHTSLAFINESTSTETQYRFAPQYLVDFPTLREWVLLRDYNQDGVEDIFTYSDIIGVSGVILYKGYYEGGRLKFERFQVDKIFNLLYASYLKNPESPIYVSSVDLPAIDDLDCDGDLDILTFNIAGGLIEQYTNQSAELGLGFDTVVFELTERCWGGVFESGFSNEVDLAGFIGECAGNIRAEKDQVEYRHAGSTLLTFDYDGDTDQDLILGDVSFDQLNLLTNAGSCGRPWIGKQDPFFPSQNVTVEIPVFPAAFWLEIGFNLQNELVAAPNIDLGAANRDMVWRYTLNENTKEFEIKEKAFLIGEMIDVGINAHPVFFDYNEDGLLDLVIGNEGIVMPEGEILPGLVVFELQQRDGKTFYQWKDNDFLAASELSISELGFKPLFVDLDGDFDEDLILGTSTGQLYFKENLGASHFGPWIPNWFGIDVGRSSTPEAYDINEDGLLDLLIGNQRGQAMLFFNKGTIDNPIFSSSPDVENWEKIDTRVAGSFDGNSAPRFVETPEETFLFTGSVSGKIMAFEHQNGTWPKISDQWEEIDEGGNSSLDFGDIDNDGFLEAIIGNKRGGVGLFETALPVLKTSQKNDANQSLAAEVVIRKAASYLYVDVMTPDPIQSSNLLIHNANGQLLFQQPLQNVRHQTLNIETRQWANGFYIFSVKVGNSVLPITQKIVLNN